MELLCCESELKKSYLDKVLFYDDRVLDKLLKLEEHYSITSNYMEFQSDIKPYMRRVVTQWMCEVCMEQNCEEEVFPLAVNMMDRFLLAYGELKRGRLQLLATACMFLSSKLKETYPMTASKLVIYTDNSITLQELLDYELLVLCKLRWDMGGVTPNDFVDLLLVRLDLATELRQRIRSQTIRYLSMCLIELEYMLLPASLLASGCICLAVSRVSENCRQQSSQQPSLGDCYQKLYKITKVDPDMLRSCSEQVRQLVTKLEAEAAAVQEQAAAFSQKEPAEHPGTPTDTLAVPIQ